MSEEAHFGRDELCATSSNFFPAFVAMTREHGRVKNVKMTKDSQGIQERG